MITFSIIILMLALNGILAAYELALTSVPLEKLRVMQDKNQKGAAAAFFMKTNIEASLSIIQLGITFCGIIAGAIGGSSSSEAIIPILQDTLHINHSLAAFMGLMLTVIPIGAFTIIFGELIPKVFALRHNLSICLRLSPFMKKFYTIFYPIATFFEFSVNKIIHLIDKLLGHKNPGSNGNNQLTLKELRIFASISRKAKQISRQEERIIVGATKLSSRPIRDIMIPLGQMCFLELNATSNESLLRTQKDAHKRYPVLGDLQDKQSIIGYVNLKELFFYAKTNPHSRSINQILRPLEEIKYNMSIADVLEKMIEDKFHLALLVDNNNQKVGIVTLEDVIEELVGDIQNEFDKLPRHIHQRGHSWIVGSGITIKHLLKATKLIPLEKLNATIDPKWTLEQYISHKLGRIPKEKDRVDLQGIDLTVAKIRRFKSQEILVQSASARQRHISGENKKVTKIKPNQ